MDSDTEKDTEFGQIFLGQFMELFVFPSIEERQAKGELKKPLNLYAAQIIFFPDGSKPIIRVNEEVRAIGKVYLKEGVSKKAGDPILYSDIEGLEKIKLTEEDFADCGHATFMKFNYTWTIAFDFLYNKYLSNKHIDTAVEFYEVGYVAQKKQLWSAFVDNLFSACELAAKAILLAMPDKKFREKTTHPIIKSRFNRFASLGNVKEEHKDVLNKLRKIRGKARYLKGDLKLTEEEAKSMISTVKEMIDFARERMSY